MTKRTLTLVLTAALCVANAQLAGAQSTSDSRLSTAPVTMEMGRYGGPLSSLLAAVAKAAGYELVLDTNVDALPSASGTSATAPAPQGTPMAVSQTAPNGKPVVYSFTGKPFNQVWPLLMDIYGLSYDMVRIGDQDVLRVSSSPIQKIIKLTNASAGDAVNQIKLFFGTPQYTEKVSDDGKGNKVTTRDLTDVKLDSLTLRIIADPRNNSIIVRGTNREIADVERLALEIDKSNSQAADSPNPVVQRVYAVKSSPAEISSLLAKQYPNLNVTPVGSSRQLVISGPTYQMDAAFALLNQVDRATVVNAGPPIVQRTFTLSNAQAVELKETLEGTLKRELGTQGGSTQVPINATDAQGNPTTVTVPAPPQPQVATDGVTPASNGATIIADQRTNSLIVRGTQAQVDQVAELVPLLDKAVPQINVQVHIQEVSESAARNLGIDWTAGIGNFTTKIVGGAISTLFDITKSFAGFNLGATLSALESQGLTKSIYDGSITLQSGQRTTGGRQGSTETTSQDAAATIKSGGRLDINLPSASGNITKQVDYGVNIDFINPQVSNDGTITLTVRSAVSKLRDPAATLNPNLIDLVNREARTSISFKNGQTVMLGGLLTTTETKTTDGVPFLSSIPVIGNLFKKTSSQNDKTQLLITITGNIVQ